MKSVENLKKLIRDQTGQNLVEYALVAALIALGSVVAVKALVTSIGATFNAVCTKLNH